jgi:hypothetical protein
LELDGLSIKIYFKTCKVKSFALGMSQSTTLGDFVPGDFAPGEFAPREFAPKGDFAPGDFAPKG